MTVDTLGRALGLYRRTAATRSAVVLLIANAIPLIGVLFFGWSLWTILVLYWLENGIVGFWNVPKILLAQGAFMPALPSLPPEPALAATGDPVRAASLRTSWQQARDAQARQSVSGPRLGGMAGAGRAVLAVFFLFHYGIFWVVHGVFIFALPSFAGSFGGAGAFGPTGSDLSGCVPNEVLGTIDCAAAAAGPFGSVVWSSVAIAGVALFISHGASFLFNYIGRAEYRTATPTGQMGAVYGRVVVLHLTIIFGSFAVAFLGAPVAALLVLVVLKTTLDLGLHLRERRRADAAWQAAASSAAPLPG